MLIFSWLMEISEKIYDVTFMLLNYDSGKLNTHCMDKLTPTCQFGIQFGIFLRKVPRRNWNVISIHTDTKEKVLY